MLWLATHLSHYFNQLKQKSFTLNIAHQNLGGKAKVARFSPIPSLHLLLQLTLQALKISAVQRDLLLLASGTLSTNIHGRLEMLRS